MSFLSKRRAAGITTGESLGWTWGLLVAASGIGWWCGHTAHIGPYGVAVYRAGVLVLAFFKAWLIGMQFMELNHAPAWLRRSYAAWVIAVCVALLFICLR